jgi:hypothetical protein
MLLFWRIRYLDSRDKQYKDRDLWLDTDSLDAVAKTAIEAIHEMGGLWHGRAILRFRNLFREENYTKEELDDRNISCKFATPWSDFHHLQATGRSASARVCRPCR